MIDDTLSIPGNVQNIGKRSDKIYILKKLVVYGMVNIEDVSENTKLGTLSEKNLIYKKVPWNWLACIIRSINDDMGQKKLLIFYVYNC